MRVESDFVLVSVPSELDGFAGVIRDENGNEIDLVLNTRFRPTHNARICAKVIAIPNYLSGMDNPLYEKYKGSPRPMAYRGHDYINRALAQMPEKYRKKESIPYMCGSYSPDHQTHFGVDPDLVEGDWVYFHFNSLLIEQNYMWKLDNGDLVYRIHYSQLFCRVRDSKIHMLNGFVLVKEILDDDIESIEVDGRRVNGKIANNLIVGVDVNTFSVDPQKGSVKKESPYSYGAKPQKGVLCHIGPGIGDDTRDILPGTLIIFRPSSEFKNNIEGEIYFVMRQWDLVAEWMDDKTIKKLNELASQRGLTVEFDIVKPVGDYVAIEPEEQEIAKTTITHVYDPLRPQPFKPGELFVPASAVSHDRKKKIHRFGLGKVKTQGERVKKYWPEHRVMFEKSAYYMYSEEYNLIFVREADLYGSFL